MTFKFDLESDMKTKIIFKSYKFYHEARIEIYDGCNKLYDKKRKCNNVIYDLHKEKIYKAMNAIGNVYTEGLHVKRNSPYQEWRLYTNTCINTTINELKNAKVI